MNEPVRLTIARNVRGGPLELCCVDPVTGFYRDGHCRSGPDDLGTHVICVRVTQGFLEFSRDRGNDLSTPVPAYRFRGLKAGDRWCLCAARWREARLAGVAPLVILNATHERALEFVTLAQLEEHAFA